MKTIYICKTLSHDNQNKNLYSLTFSTDKTLKTSQGNEQLNGKKIREIEGNTQHNSKRHVSCSSSKFNFLFMLFESERRHEQKKFTSVFLRFITFTSATLRIHKS